jgi:hypothetical protein
MSKLMLCRMNFLRNSLCNNIVLIIIFLEIMYILTAPIVVQDLILNLYVSYIKEKI